MVEHLIVIKKSLGLVTGLLTKRATLTRQDQ